jgi:probable HAF family extracellular repeat protein
VLIVVGVQSLAWAGLPAVAGPVAGPVVPGSRGPGYGIADVGSGSFIVDVNDRGDVLGYLPTPVGSRAFVWRGGRRTEIGTFGGADSFPADINERGDVVGFAQLPSGAAHPFLWRAGVLSDLGTLGGSSGGAWAINNVGDIVGASDDAAGATHAFRWRAGVMTDLSGPGRPIGAAIDINDRGDVLAVSGSGGLRWRDGRWTQLREPGGAAVQPTRMNERGTVLGLVARDPDHGEYTWSVWPVGSYADTGLSFGSAVLNNSDQIAGTLVVDNMFRAVVWQHGVLRQLPGDQFNMPAAINDRGDVAGASWHDGIPPRAVVWTGGRMVPLPPAGFDQNVVDHLNAGGTVTGGGLWQNGDRDGLVWQLARGSIQRLPPQPAPRSTGRQGPADATPPS